MSHRLMRLKRRPAEPGPEAGSCPQAGAATPPDVGLAGGQRSRLHRLSDRALLDAVGRGSRAALRELFHRHGDAVQRLAGLLVTDGEDTDRVVEDVFVTLWRRGGRLEDDVENVRLGLLSMARHRCGPAVDAAPRPRELPVGVGRSPGEAAAMSRLRCLPSGDREALALTVLAAATLADVAVVLDTDRRTVGSRLRSGLRHVAV